MFKNDINLNLYKTFYDVAKFKSFSKAAEFTYSTQPAISKSIKKLESELETKLFYRKTNGVELTEQGKELLYYVEKSLGNLLTAERVLLERDNLNRGKLSIGIPSNLYSMYLMEKITEFKKKYSKIKISILTGSTSYLLSKLESHSIDFIIDTLPIETFNNDITINKLFDLNYCFVSNKKYKFNNIGDMINEKLILPIEGTNNRIELDEFFFKYGIKDINSFDLHTSEMIVESVINGLGIGYVLEEYVDDFIKNNKLYKIDLKDKLPKVEVALIYNKKFLTNVPRKFINDYITKI